MSPKNFDEIVFNVDPLCLASFLCNYKYGTALDLGFKQSFRKEKQLLHLVYCKHFRKSDVNCDVFQRNPLCKLHIRTYTCKCLACITNMVIQHPRYQHDNG